MPINVTETEKAILQRAKIPPRPEALLTISEQARQEEPDVGVISDAIMSDVSMSAAVLQVVNSAVFRREKEIQSIQQAAMTLGFKRLLPLVKAVALRSAIGENDRLGDFWQHATLVASAASLAASALQREHLRDHAYMLGLFHNAGVPIMALEFDGYDSIMRTAEQSGWDQVMEEERSQFGTSHTTMSALLAQKWKLPAIMVHVLYYQHEVDGLFASGELGRLGLDLISILKLARYCAYYSQTGNPENREWEAIQDDILSHFGLDEMELDDIRDNLMEQIGEIYSN